MKKNFLLIFMILFLNNKILSQQTNNIITLFIDEYPQEKTSYDKQSLNEICKLYDKRIHNCNGIEFPFNYGIFATYSGYLGLSDQNGQITFARKTQKNSINLLVVDRIRPIFMLKNTIAYWEISHGANAKMYKIERKRDEETKTDYCNVTEKNLPKNNRIPIHTIIIFANPESIYVPLGITITKQQDSHFILPKIYAKNNYEHLKNALFLLSIKPFFGSVKKITKEIPLGYQMHVIP